MKRKGIGDAMSAIHVAWDYFRNADFRGALLMYETAAELAPASTAPLFGVLDCHVAMGDAENAARTVERIVALGGVAR